MMSIIEKNQNPDLIVIPGQGGQEKIYDIPSWLSQYPEQYQVYTDTFLLADEYLKDDFAAEQLNVRLADVCFNKTPENLELLTTDHKVIQTAIFTTEIALWNVFRSMNLEAKYVAGHSLGEYAALVVAGSMSFKDALIAVYERAKAMEESAKAMPEAGGMVVVTGPETEVIQTILYELGDNDTEIVNHNAFNMPQFVLSGLARNVKGFAEKANTIEKTRATMMKIPGAYHHSEYGRAAAEKLKDKFKERNLSFSDPLPNLRLLGNQLQFLESAQSAREHVADQLKRGVQWANGMKKLVEEEGVVTVVEIGAGKALGSLAERDFKGKVVVKTLAQYVKEYRGK